ncbi:hypothetical protein Scep_009820 [Stephania cephalantha]|uniref:Uncharacterized protein n=1 Tax=Stephania cephalantha TaxID=152367 RepID=A0AAP0PEN7_9MAGN
MKLSSATRPRLCTQSNIRMTSPGEINFTSIASLRFRRNRARATAPFTASQPPLSPPCTLRRRAPLAGRLRRPSRRALLGSPAAAGWSTRIASRAARAAAAARAATTPSFLVGRRPSAPRPSSGACRSRPPWPPYPAARPPPPRPAVVALRDHRHPALRPVAAPYRATSGRGTTVRSPLLALR